jgi:cytoskeletal protein CcmA (bactofilin family)
MFSNTKKETIKDELSNSSNIIGKGTSLEGNLHTAGNLRVEGKVIGEIHSKAKVVLGETSAVEGSIIAQNSEIGGEVQGTIRVTGLLTLKTTAVVNGDIITSKLIFEEGAKFNGKCDMGGAIKENQPSQSQAVSHKKNGSLIEQTPQQAAVLTKGT